MFGGAPNMSNVVLEVTVEKVVSLHTCHNSPNMSGEAPNIPCQLAIGGSRCQPLMHYVLYVLPGDALNKYGACTRLVCFYVLFECRIRWSGRCCTRHVLCPLFDLFQSTPSLSVIPSGASDAPPDGCDAYILLKSSLQLSLHVIYGVTSGAPPDTLVYSQLFWIVSLAELGGIPLRSCLAFDKEGDDRDNILHLMTDMIEMKSPSSIRCCLRNLHPHDSKISIWLVVTK